MQNDPSAHKCQNMHYGMTREQRAARKEAITAFGQRLKAARRAKGMSQKQAAASLGLSHTTISTIECGAVESISVNMVSLLTDFIEGRTTGQA